MGANAASQTRRLALLGSIPPPYGGVAVHIQRLRPLLDERGIEHHTFNAVSDTEGENVTSVASHRTRWLLRYLATATDDAVYVFSDRLYVWLAATAACRLRRRPVIINVRNARLVEWMEHNPGKAEAAGRVLQEVDLVVAVSHRLRDACITLGVAPERVVYAPAFLPPSAATDDEQMVDEQVWTFIRRWPKFIAANGKVNFHDGQDLYGLDMMVTLMSSLQHDHPDLGLVVCFWDHLDGDQAYLDALVARATELGVADRILFNTRPGQFVPVLKRAACFIRPTNTDGDAVSVRESLYFGLPTVASDAVERPDGTLLHRTRDAADLERQVRAALHQDVGGDELEHNRLVVERYLNALQTVVEG